MWTPQVPKESGREFQPAVPTTQPRSMDEDRAMAAIGKSVFFKGALLSAEDVTIAGRMEGSIDVRDHSVTIAPEADIQADIVAKRVIVQGKVTGHITASDKVALDGTASVEGNIRSPMFMMADGAQVRGRVETGNRNAGAVAESAAR